MKSSHQRPMKMRVANPQIINNLKQIRMIIRLHKLYKEMEVEEWIG